MSVTALIYGRRYNDNNRNWGMFSNIPPILQSQVGIVLPETSSYPAGTYYNSASMYNNNVEVFALFSEEP